MANKNLHTIISEINARAKSHPIGALHEIRKVIKKKKRLPAQGIFTDKTTFERYAYHHGGRRELQFNVGYDDAGRLRYGIAFSLQINQTLPNIEMLIPKIKLFNDFMQLYPEEYSDMRMWHYSDEQRSPDYLPNSIPPELIKNNTFIFLGMRCAHDEIDYELILNVLDRLLPLYQYVENNGIDFPSLTLGAFEFYPKTMLSKKSSTKTFLAQKEIDINLRHNMLQEGLCQRLSEQYGSDNVSFEVRSGIGTSIDVVVRQNNEYWFYEIKTSLSSRICLRQAIGQLLEYAFWPNAQNATRLIVIGESALDKEGEKYLEALRERFSLTIEYEQFVYK